MSLRQVKGQSRALEVSILKLQRLVTEEEIRKMRELRKKGLSIMKIARILHRSPATVNHYLKSNQRMSHNELSKM